MEGLIDTWKADTLEELAKKLRIQDVPAFLETVKHYNEMAHAGRIRSSAFRPITSARWKRVRSTASIATSGSRSAAPGSRSTSAGMLDKDDKPIPGLYAIGNLAGNFYGSVDYPLDIFGLNLGHNYTEGYVVAEELAKL